MGMRTEKELEACGCNLTLDQFNDVLQDIWGVVCPSWSVDELACHPTVALQFCEAVRQRVKARVPEEVTMHALFNARKH